MPQSITPTGLNQSNRKLYSPTKTHQETAGRIDTLMAPHELLLRYIHRTNNAVFRFVSALVEKLRTPSPTQRHHRHILLMDHQQMGWVSIDHGTMSLSRQHDILLHLIEHSTNHQPFLTRRDAPVGLAGMTCLPACLEVCGRISEQLAPAERMSLTHKTITTTVKTTDQTRSTYCTLPYTSNDTQIMHTYVKDDGGRTNRRIHSPSLFPPFPYFPSLHPKGSTVPWQVTNKPTMVSGGPLLERQRRRISVSGAAAFRTPGDEKQEKKKLPPTQ